KAPIRVKRGASPQPTEALVKQLLDLGADVVVTNEQSGDKRTYRAAERSMPPPNESGSRSPKNVTPISIEPPPASVIESGRPTGAALLAQAIADRRSRASGEPSIPAATPSTRSRADAAAARVDPPATPVAEERKSLEPCASCTRPVEKDEICSRCGYSNLGKTRYCRQCKGELSIGSLITSRRG